MSENKNNNFQNKLSILKQKFFLEKYSCKTKLVLSVIIITIHSLRFFRLSDYEFSIIIESFSMSPSGAIIFLWLPTALALTLVNYYPENTEFKRVFRGCATISLLLFPYLGGIVFILLVIALITIHFRYKRNQTLASRRFNLSKLYRSFTINKMVLIDVLRDVLIAFVIAYTIHYFAKEMSKAGMFGLMILYAIAPFFLGAILLVIPLLSYHFKRPLIGILIPIFILAVNFFH